MDDQREIVGAAVRTILAAVPGCSWIAQAWSEYESYKQKQRIELFFRNLAQAMQRAERQIRQHEEYSRQSGEFPLLLEKTLDFVSREPSETRTNQHATLLANCLAAGPDLPPREKIDYILLLEFLTEDDLSLLGVFYPDKNIRVEKLHESIRTFGGKPTKHNLATVIFSLSKLESRGLVSQTEDNIGHQAWAGPIDNWYNRWLFKHYTILSHGKMLVDLLRVT